MSEIIENIKKEDLVFEDKITKAKELLEKLSNPQITLNESLKIYQDGLKELELAQKLLEEAKLIFITQSNNS